jgi:hypothetical protein
VVEQCTDHGAIKRAVVYGAQRRPSSMLSGSAAGLPTGHGLLPAEDIVEPPVAYPHMAN